MSALDLFKQHVKQTEDKQVFETLNDMKNLLKTLAEQQVRLANTLYEICSVNKNTVSTTIEDQDIDSMIQYHKSALDELYKKKNKKQQKKKNQLTVEKAEELANLLNNFYIVDYKKRKQMFDEKIRYIGQVANHKYMTFEEMSNYLDEIDNILSKYKGVYILPEAKSLFMKVYYYVGKYGDDAVYYEKVFLK